MRGTHTASRARHSIQWIKINCRPKNYLSLAEYKIGLFFWCLLSFWHFVRSYTGTTRIPHGALLEWKMEMALTQRSTALCVRPLWSWFMRLAFKGRPSIWFPFSETNRRRERKKKLPLRRIFLLRTVTEYKLRIIYSKELCVELCTRKSRKMSQEINNKERRQLNQPSTATHEKLKPFGSAHTICIHFSSWPCPRRQSPLCDAVDASHVTSCELVEPERHKSRLIRFVVVISFVCLRLHSAFPSASIVGCDCI